MLAISFQPSAFSLLSSDFCFLLITHLAARKVPLNPESRILFFWCAGNVGCAPNFPLYGLGKLDVVSVRVARNVASWLRRFNSACSISGRWRAASRMASARVGTSSGCSSGSRSVGTISTVANPSLKLLEISAFSDWASWEKVCCAANKSCRREATSA